ncbi:MAG TPA: deoxyribose-phosphate aldolase [Ilumatobacter sp.]
MDTQRARMAISLVDLTNLADDCDDGAVDELCVKAIAAGTAAVCVWPDFVARCAAALAGTPVAVATVVNFPSGGERPHAVGVVTERALADGADEIDVVLPYHAFASGDRARCTAVLTTVRVATTGRALMKVILETGELVDADLIRSAARLAIDLGADFVKTSTGKTPVSATPEAAEIMLREIAAAGRPVGLKPSGGIRTAADAERYLALAESVMGPGWPAPATFRFGASGLLDALVEAAGGPPGRGDATAY